MKLVALVVVAGAYFGSGPKTFAQVNSSAQPTTTAQSGIDQDIQFLRLDIRSKKKQIIAANLSLTDVEATKFWPVYDQYTADLVKINNEKYAVLKEYAEAGAMTDEQGLSLIKRALAVDEQVAQLRTKYVSIFNKVVSGKTVATFFQIERRVQAMIDLQLASQLPLVQAQQ